MMLSFSFEQRTCHEIGRADACVRLQFRVHDLACTCISP